MPGVRENTNDATFSDGPEMADGAVEVRKWWELLKWWWYGPDYYNQPPTDEEKK